MEGKYSEGYMTIDLNPKQYAAFMSDRFFLYAVSPKNIFAHSQRMDVCVSFTYNGHFVGSAYLVGKGLVQCTASIERMVLIFERRSESCEEALIKKPQVRATEAKRKRSKKS